MGLNIDEILKSLEAEKTAEAKFADGIAEEATEEATEEAEEETEKLAAEYDAQGRVMARAFMDELQKVAVATGVYTGHSADMSKKPVELVTGDVPEAGKADAVINKLREYEAAAQGSYVQADGVIMPAPNKAVDETFGSTAVDGNPDKNAPVGGEAAVEAEEEKTAEAEETSEERILGTLYNAYFGEE